MHPQLEASVRYFEEMRKRLHRLAASLPPERWSARNDPTSWSVAECVAHLNLTSEAYVPLLGTGIEEARALGGPAPSRYRMDAAGWVISKLAGPMLRFRGQRVGRGKTAAAFVPSGDLPREALLAEFDRLQDEQIAAARDSEGLPIDRVKVPSPFGPNLRYSVYSCLVILPRHQQRHLEQAEAVWGDG